MLYRLITSRVIGNIVFALLIVGFGMFVLHAANKIEYNWRWNRVPQYIIYVAKEEFTAKANGVVRQEDGGIYIDLANGTRDLVTDNGKLAVENGSNVIIGDLIATHREVSMGPLLKGLLMTLKISVVSIIFAILIGVFTGLMRISPVYVLKKLAITYVEIIRGTPLLVQIFILYFFFGKIFNLSQFTAGVAALSIFTGAYIAEIFRAGVQSVSRGQTEAARSLGMSYLQTMQYVVMPQALKRTLPPMAGQFISLIKDSSLVSVIAITDLTKAGREVISANLSPFEVWFSVALMYLILTTALSYAVNRLELHLAKSD